MSDTIRWQLRKAPAGAPWKWAALCPSESRQRFFETFPELAGFLGTYGLSTERLNELLSPLREAEGAASVEIDLPRKRPAKR